MPSYYTALLAYLWLVKARIADGNYPEYGLCSAIEHTDDEEVHVGWNVLSEFMFRSWPEYAGSSWFPVPGAGGPGDRQSAEQCFDLALDWCKGDPSDRVGTHPFWTGEYGSARIRLLNHCINQLQRAIDTGVEL